MIEREVNGQNGMRRFAALAMGIAAVLAAALFLCPGAGEAEEPDEAAGAALSASGAALEAQASTVSSKDFTAEVKKDGTLAITGYTGSAKNVTFPSKIGGRKVTSIAPRWTTSTESVTSVAIPATVTDIGIADNSVGYYPAFCGEYYPKLKSITVAAGNPKYSSVDGVLFDKKKTKLVSFPAMKTTKSYSIPSTVKSIEKGAFRCASLTGVDIPSSVKTLGDSSFTSSKLKSVVIPQSVKKVGALLFYGCSSLKTIEVAAPLKTISFGFASLCTSLKSVSLPEGLKALNGETGGFRDFGAFYSCESLSKIDLPSSLNQIDSSVFAKCSKLSVTIPSSVVEIGRDAFTGVKKVSGLSRYAAVPVSGSDADSREMTPEYARAVTVKVSGSMDYPAAWQMVDLLNKARAKAGKQELMLAKSLTTSAMKNAAALSACYSKVDMPGNYADNLKTVFKSTGPVSSAFAKASKAYVTTSEYSDNVGIGCFLKGGTRYWVIIGDDIDYDGAYAELSRSESNARQSVSQSMQVWLDGLNVKLSLSACKASVKPQKYTGKAVKPKPAVTYTSGGKTISLVEGVDYTLSYSHNKAHGKAKAILKGKGNFSGKKTVRFVIR